MACLTCDPVRAEFGVLPDLLLRCVGSALRTTAHGVSTAPDTSRRHPHLVHISTVIHRRQSCTVWCGLAGRVAKSDGLVVHREHRGNIRPFDGVAGASRLTHEHLMRANEA